MLTAHATEIVLAVPPSMRDMYQLHQAVWDHVDRSQAVRHRPVILYRQDQGMVRVRVSDCAIMYGRGRPDRASFAEGHAMDWQMRLALWRDLTQSRDIKARIMEMLERAGVEVQFLRFRKGMSEGRKRHHLIRLPVADVEAHVRISDPIKARHAWVHGLGRGRRFGFGMILAG